MFDIALDMAAKKPKLEQQLVLRVDGDLMDDIQDGHRLLTLLAKTNNDDVPSFSKALRRVIRIGLDVVFGKVGGRPQSEADWSALEASLQSTKKH